MTARRLLRAVTGLATSVGAVLTASIAMAEPQPESGLGLPRDVSADGHRIDWLMGFTNVLTGILFLIMVGWILYAAIGHNSKRHVAAHDHGTSRRSIFIVLGISGSIFFVVDGNLFFNSTTDLENVFHNFEKVEHDPTSIRVEINAHQWAWDTRQAGPDGKFNTKDDIVSLNDLRIPVDTPVIFEVASTDVLHAFNLPNFRAKVDAVPGQINRFWVQGKTVGEYEIGCAQHCGTNHYKMKGQITVLSKEDYARWADEASKNSARLFDENDHDAHWGWEWKGN
jgi:cytochrome c oxidase subunit 2